MTNDEAEHVVIRPSDSKLEIVRETIDQAIARELKLSKGEIAVVRVMNGKVEVGVTVEMRSSVYLRNDAVSIRAEFPRSKMGQSPLKAAWSSWYYNKGRKEASKATIEDKNVQKLEVEMRSHVEHVATNLKKIKDGYKLVCGHRPDVCDTACPQCGKEVVDDAAWWCLASDGRGWPLHALCVKSWHDSGRKSPIAASESADTPPDLPAKPTVAQLRQHGAKFYVKKSANASESWADVAGVKFRLGDDGYERQDGECKP